jgi:hypothetical protein
VFAVFALVLGVAIAVLPEIREMRWHSYEMSGSSLRDAAAQKHEERLDRNPGDLRSRVTLLGYYSHRISTVIERQNYYRHASWLIEHEPLVARETVMNALYHSETETDAAALERAKALWMNHVSERPNDAEILLAAGEFMMLHDVDEAEGLFARAKTHAREGSALSKEITSRQAELAARRLQREREAPSND